MSAPAPPFTNQLKVSAPAAGYQSAARAGGRPPRLSRRLRLRIGSLVSHVDASSFLLGGADSDSSRSLEEKPRVGGASGAGGARGRSRKAAEPAGEPIAGGQS